MISAQPGSGLKLKPVISGEWLCIAPEPDLSGIGLQPEPDTIQINQTNDHTIFTTGNNKWHLWACVRRTKVGRILAHWTADSLTQTPWQFTGEVIRCDKNAGESLIEWMGQEFIQSPFVVRFRDIYYMLYGGYSTGLDPDGMVTGNYNSIENQISLMMSPDGYSWKRHSGNNNYSRVFSGPGAARDPCVTRFNGSWYIYYCGHHNRDRYTGAIYARTSSDLIHWSDWQIVQYEDTLPEKKILPESPFVVCKDGFYYLFRTHGLRRGTYVFRSTDPVNFGIGDVRNYFVTFLPDVIAPEIVQDREGNEYITNIWYNDRYSISIAPLRWEPEN
jgi:beta-fructofuranosidase